MEKKRGLPASYIILFCSLLFFSSFAIAEDPSEEALGRSAEIFGKVLYDVFSSAEKLFSSVSVSVNVDPGMVIYLYFIAILFFFVYAIVDSMNFFPDNWIIKGVVAIAITGLAYIALPANFYMFFFPAHQAAWTTIVHILFFGVIVFFLVKIRSLPVAYLISISITVMWIVYFFSSGSETGTFVFGPLQWWLLTISIVQILLTIFLRPIRRRFFNDEAAEDAQEMEAGMGLLETMMGSVQKMADRMYSARR